MNDQDKAKAVAFNAMVAAVANALNGTVTKRADEEQGYWHCAKITTGAGLPLSVHSRNCDAKLSVSVDLPSIKGRDGSSSYQSVSDILTYEERCKADTPAPTHEIGVSATKTPDRIAADITRRLVPGATILWERAIARRDDCEKYTNGTNETIARLAKRLRVEPRGSRLYVDGVTLDVSGPDYVRIDHCSVSAECAAKIAELIRADKSNKDEDAA